MTPGHTLSPTGWIPFFRNAQPIYDPAILKDKPQLSLRRS